MLEMVKEAKSKAPNETGGILLGYWSLHQKEAVIAKVIGPGPKATHTTYSFYPDGDFHQSQIEREYFRSNREHTYLGDWHTHSSVQTELSSIDRATLKKIANTHEARAPNPLMLILLRDQTVGATIWKWEPRIWQGIRLGWKATRMNLKFFG